MISIRAHHTCQRKWFRFGFLKFRSWISEMSRYKVFKICIHCEVRSRVYFLCLSIQPRSVQFRVERCHKFMRKSSKMGLEIHETKAANIYVYGQICHIMIRENELTSLANRIERIEEVHREQPFHHSCLWLDEFDFAYRKRAFEMSQNAKCLWAGRKINTLT